MNIGVLYAFLFAGTSQDGLPDSREKLSRFQRRVQEDNLI